MSDDSAEGQPHFQSVRPLYVALVLGALLFAVAWLFLPTWDFLVEPVDPNARADITKAIEEATEPTEQAGLRLELERLEQEAAARRSSLRGTIAALLAGGVAAWGALSAWRQLQDNRELAEAARKDTGEQLRLARDTQLTERFTRAVDQLGHENLDVRLGGIYALERIAADSHTDLPTVVEVLAAFVRSHSRRTGGIRRTALHEMLISPIVMDVLGTLTRSHSHRTGGFRRTAFRRALFLFLPFERDDGWSQRLGGPPADVKAALTALGRIDYEPRSFFDLDLAGVDAEGSNLVRVDLAGAWLIGANLTNAWLVEANLKSARLDGANLKGARLRRANLEGAQLEGANLKGAVLREANLESARLDGANLKGARLEEANLKGAVLGGVNLAGAWLGEANLESARLDGANLKGARLESANLTNAAANSKTRWPKRFDPKVRGVAERYGGVNS